MRNLFLALLIGTAALGFGFARSGPAHAHAFTALNPRITVSSHVALGDAAGEGRAAFILINASTCDIDITVSSWPTAAGPQGSDFGTILPGDSKNFAWLSTQPGHYTIEVEETECSDARLTTELSIDAGDTLAVSYSRD